MLSEAFAKHYNPQGTGNLSGFAAALTTAFGVSAASTGEAALAYQTLNTYGGVVAGGGGNGNSSYPKAFVTILLFDKDYKLVDFTFDQINGGQQVGVSPKAAHDAMMCEYTVKEAGYAYMYISNENPTMVEVYFDDITVTYTPSNLIQGNEYYPFGMQTANSWTRDGNKNDYLYNQGTELNATSGWYETFFRGYDPALGKFLQVDPMTDKYASWTPYNYGFNSPGVFNDPLGDDAGSSVRGGYSYASMGGCGCWQDKGPQDAHAGADGGMFGSSWNMLTYGSATIGGSAFPRYGPGNNGMHAYEAAHTAARKMGGTVRQNDGRYWVQVGIEQYYNTELYTGWSGGVMAIEMGDQMQGGYPPVLQAAFFPAQFEYSNLLLNIGSTIVGIGEQGLRYVRQYPNGPRDIARGISNLIGKQVGTQATARFLSKTFNGAKSLGSKLGGLGVIVSTTDYIANFGDKNGYDHANYWIGMGVMAVSYAIPVVGILYGGAQLASYLYNGKTLEENIGKVVGY